MAKRRSAYALYIGAAEKPALESNSFRPLVRHALKTMKPGEAAEIRGGGYVALSINRRNRP